MNNFISLNKNYMLSSLSKKDLKDVINIIDKFYLVYRDTLNLDKSVSFGPEIEYEYVPTKTLVDNFIKVNFNKWESKKDYSLDALLYSGEISSPILHDDRKCWYALQKICEYLKELNANTSLNASCHIHSGAHILGNNTVDWIKYLKLYL